ncbi:MAG: hypothetical protein Alpg2KO_18390 [Alphaproteobacteria bacterium]
MIQYTAGSVFPAGRRVDGSMPEGASLEQVYRSLGWPDSFDNQVVIALHRAGRFAFVPRGNWHLVRPRPGTVVTINIRPAGGGGKNPLRLILSLAVTALSFGVGSFIGAGTLLGGLASAATNIVGRLVINALIPPPEPATPYTPAEASPTLQGAGNRINRFGTVPRVLGRHRVTPPLAAPPVTEQEDGEEYLRMLFDFGHGPLDLSDFRIGDTPLDSYDGIEMETTTGRVGEELPALARRSLAEIPFNVELEKDTPFLSNTGQPVDEFTIEFTLPEGLGAIGRKSGNELERTVRMRVEWRELGSDDAWETRTRDWIDDAPGTPQFRDIRVRVPTRKVIEFRLTRLTEHEQDGGNREYWKTVFTGLRLKVKEKPVNATGRALVALRIRASDQLSGVIDSFNAIAESLLPVWDGTEWAETKTRHPAWAMCEVLRGAANQQPVSDASLDLEAFRVWATEEPDWTFDAVVDFQSTVQAMLRQIAATGRARPGFRGGRHSIIRDVAQTVPVQFFSPRNCTGFTGSRAMEKLPDAFRVTYLNEERDWQQTEIIVPRDGQSTASATTYEQLDLPGITSTARAFQLARYHLAVAQLRPEIYELACDIDHLACEPGDLVRVSHDTPVWGGRPARVLRQIDSGTAGFVSGFELDEPASATHTDPVLGWRDDSGWQQAAISAVEGRVVSLATDLLAADAPAVGSHVVTGENGSEARDLIVQSIRHESDFRARLKLVDASPEVLTAGAGELPEFDPGIDPGLIDPRPGPVRRLTAGQVTSDARGRGHADVSFAWQPPNGPQVVTGYELFRRSAGRWQLLGRVTGQRTTIPAVRVGKLVKLRVRARGVNGAAGPCEDARQLDYRVVEDTTRPPDVSELRLTELETRQLRLSWTLTEEVDDLAGYELRIARGQSRSWSAASPLTEGLVTSRSLTVPHPGGGRWSLFVKAVDRAGLRSRDAAVAVIGLGDRQVRNLVQTVDLSGGGVWADATGGVVEDSVLKAETDAARFWSGSATPFWKGDAEPFWSGNDNARMWPGDSAPMWGDDRAAFWTGRYPTLRFETNLTPAAAGTLELVAQGDGDLVVEIANEFPDPFWSGDDSAPFWGPDDQPFWNRRLRWERVTTPIEVTAKDYRVRVTVPPGSVRGEVSLFEARLDLPDRVTRLEDVSISASGTRLTVSGYSSISHVSLTLQDDGGSAVTARLKDKLASGPLVECRDASGTGVSGTVDAEVGGY